MKTVFRIYKYLKNYPSLAIGYIICAIISSLAVIIFPTILQKLIDDVIPYNKKELILPFTLMAIGGFFIQDFLEYLRICLNNKFEQSVIFDIRSDLYNHLQKLPLKWFDNNKTGDIMTRVTEDVTSMERVLIDGIEQGIISIFIMIIITIVLFMTNTTLAFISLIPIPFFIIGAISYRATSLPRHKKTREATSTMNSLINDNISGIRQIKSYNIEKSEHAHFNEKSNNVKKSNLNVMYAWAIYKPSMNFLKNLGYVLIIFFGGLWTLSGKMTIGELTKFLFLINYFYMPVTNLHAFNHLLQAGRASAERVFEILDTKPEPQLSKNIKVINNCKGHIIYKDVNFSYNGTLNTLKNINIEVKPGQTVALVGHTGSGKSSIVNLLPRFYNFQSGDILIDDISINSLNKDNLRQQIGFVTQESFLFNGTILENIVITNKKYANAKSDNNLMDKVWHALEVANASEFVKKLPNGIDSLVGERGIKLSVGEKQRISIARAVLKDPPILLLDEATASVDNKTEKLIQNSLDSLLKNRSSIVIAHRLTTIQHADVIYVLEGGKIIEKGDHSSLLKNKSYYFNLINSINK